MSDLIRRQDVEDAVQGLHIGDIYFFKKLRERLDAIPSAEPEQTLESAIDYLQSTGWLQEHDRILTESAEPERKKGEWIEYPDCLGYDSAYSDDHIVCSECEHVFSICDNCTEEFDFCPHCGADMRGE